MIVRSCGQLPATVISVNVIVGLTSQLSVPVAVPVLAGSVLAVQDTVILDGHVMAGPVKSSMVMVCTQVLKLPQSSCERHVRAMVYSCVQLGDAVVTSV